MNMKRRRKINHNSANQKKESMDYYDYSRVPATEQDRDAYKKKLSYYTRRMHNKQSHYHHPSCFTKKLEQLPAIKATKESDSRLESILTPTSTTTSTSTGTKSIDSKQKRTVVEESHQNEEQGEFFFNPQIFQKQGRGNAKKKIKMMNACHCPSPTTNTSIKPSSCNYNDDKSHLPDADHGILEFIGFIGTNFPARLHDLISRPSFVTWTGLDNNNDSSSNSYAVLGSNNNNADMMTSNVISWLPHGRSWIVRDSITFIESVATTHFNVTHYKSFIRQVNGWGFRRVTRGPDSGSYHHPVFLRGMPHLTKFMKRERTESTCSPSYISDLAHNEGISKIIFEDKRSPDFYAVSKKYPIPDHYAFSSPKRSTDNTDITQRKEMGEGRVNEQEQDHERNGGTASEYVITRDSTSRDADSIQQQQNTTGSKSSCNPIVSIDQLHLKRPNNITASEGEVDVEGDVEGAFSPQQKKVRGNAFMTCETQEEEEVRNHENKFFQRHEDSQLSDEWSANRQNSAQHHFLKNLNQHAGYHIQHPASSNGFRLRDDSFISIVSTLPGDTKTSSSSSSSSQHRQKLLSNASSTLFQHQPSIICENHWREGLEKKDSTAYPISDTNVTASSRNVGNNYNIIWSTNTNEAPYLDDQEGTFACNTETNRAPLRQKDYSNFPSSSWRALRRNTNIKTYSFCQDSMAQLSRERQEQRNGHSLIAIDEVSRIQQNFANDDDDDDDNDNHINDVVLKDFLEELFINDSILDFHNM